MKKPFSALLVITAMLLAVTCGREKPGDPDGQSSLIIYAVDTSGVTSDEWTPIAGAMVRIHCTTHDYHSVFFTDDEGRTVVDYLPAGRYMIQAEKSDDIENILILGQKEKTIIYEPAGLDTVFMKYITASPLVINEVYFCGCSQSSYYWYDQFIELHNSSNDTIYLDGFFMCRGTQIAEVLDFESVDYALGYYVYAFPGERGVTRNCPIPPKGFLIIAGDALNHNHPQYRPLCVDLENADWEFFNSLGSDYDNLNVPNLEPVTSWGVDFTYNLSHSSLWLATGEEYVFEYHYDPYMNQDKLYCHIPLWTIIDAVEYSGNPDSPKYVTIRIDAGLGGNGISKWSAMSIERRYPGLDSNNSTFDFEIISPTPGYQH